MEKRNILKTGIVIILILLAGILYSCRGQDSDTQIVLKDETADQTASQQTAETDTLKTKDAKKENSSDTTEAAESAKPKGSQSGQDIAEEKSTAETSDNMGNTIYIHICGAVKKPGVYEVEAGTRLVDVIKLAGGLTKDAAGDYVNQASKVEDGQKVYIPAGDEVKDLQPGILTGDINQSGPAEGTSASESPGSIDSGSSGIVNINTASAEELMTLPGIGESKAESIITYRQEHGGFKATEEIKNINGIKDSVYNKISDMITVN